MLTKAEEIVQCFVLRFKAVGLISDLKRLFETQLLKGAEDEESFHVNM